MLFSTRSRKGITRLSLIERASITIPDEIKDILVGILLGDALVRKVVKFVLISYLFSLFLSYITISLEENTMLASIPILSYSDPKGQKSAILAEIRGKSGIYVWKNQTNGKKYIGSSVDLTTRLRNYFNISYLSDLKRIMVI